VLVHGLLDSPAVFNALKRCLGNQRQPLLIPELPLRFGLTPISEAAEGHFQVLAGPHRGNAIAHPEDEIGHHEAPESPALLEDFVEQHGVLAAPLAIHLVVCAHQRARPGLYAGAEVGQVKLVQHPFTHLHVHQEAGAVDRVEGEMLDAGHGVALDAAGHCRPSRGGAAD